MLDGVKSEPDTAVETGGRKDEYGRTLNRGIRPWTVTEESVCRYEKLFRKQKRNIARQRIIADLHHRHRCSISHIHIPSLGMNRNAGQKKDEGLWLNYSSVSA